MEHANNLEERVAQRYFESLKELTLGYIDDNELESDSSALGVVTFGLVTLLLQLYSMGDRPAKDTIKDLIDALPYDEPVVNAEVTVE